MFEVFGAIAIGAATAGGFAFGAIWYSVLGKVWMRAANLSEEKAKPAVSVMVLTFGCQIVLALAMAGVMWHMGISSIRGGLISALLIWGGFVLTTMIVNHRFQARPWSLTVIDSGHWLGGLIIHGAILGALSN